MLLDSDLRRSASITSLHSNPEVNRHDNNLSDPEQTETEVTQSVSIAAENIARGHGTRRHTASGSNDIHYSATASTNGVGYFTSSGGTLTNRSSGVLVEVPPGVVPKGRRQKIWLEFTLSSAICLSNIYLINLIVVDPSYLNVLCRFEVQQTVYRESDEEDIYTSFNRSSNRVNSVSDSSKVRVTP